MFQDSMNGLGEHASELSLTDRQLLEHWALSQKRFYGLVKFCHPKRLDSPAPETQLYQADPRRNKSKLKAEGTSLAIAANSRHWLLHRSSAKMLWIAHFRESIRSRN